MSGRRRAFEPEDSTGDSGGPPGREPGESTRIHVGSFPRLWDKLLEKGDFEVERKELDLQSIADEFNVPVNIAEELASVCSTSSLHSKNTEKIDWKHYGMIDGVLPEGGERLQTVRLRTENYRQCGKYCLSVQGKWHEYDYRTMQSTACHPLNKPIVLLHVSVTFSCKTPKSPRRVKHDRELIVHSDQPLTALKDKLVCPLDLVYVSAECSDVPDIKDETRAQDLFKSSYFFIENVFYQDTRNPLARDISEPVREWLNKGKSDVVFGDVSCAKMSETTFKDLTIRLGYPYLYCHQGDCEHIITFTDVRFLHEYDCQDLEQYPILSNQSVYHKVHCVSCKLLVAKWMTQEDSLSPTDPSFFCDACFHQLHYDTDGNKTGTFRAYRHLDPSIFR